MFLILVITIKIIFIFGKKNEKKIGKNEEDPQQHTQVRMTSFGRPGPVLVIPNYQNEVIWTSFR